MKVLILGVTGMLGSAVFKVLHKDQRFNVWGTLRNAGGLHDLPKHTHENLICNVDVLDFDNLIAIFETVRPEVVINCVGLIKQHADAKSPLLALPINAMLPHRLANISSLAHARLIHISTDCVFSGKKGMYVEDDISDAEDLYGKSKYIGELTGYPHVVTLRTSIIGHELNSQNSLVDWFLSQEGVVKGYKKSVFSGLPTVELADVIRTYILPVTDLSGLYHVSGEAIDKFSLLGLIAKAYGKTIEIEEDSQVVIDRSLDSTIFRNVTGYQPKGWTELIKKMHQAQLRGVTRYV